MGVDINCLPLAMQQQALKKLQQTRVPQAVHKIEPKENKFHNTPTESGGIKFPSKHEADRFGELMLMLKAGKIRDLRLQVNFTLQEGYTTSEGKRIRPIIYKADFTYYLVKEGLCADEYVVEDTKSKPTKTKTYLMKKKMMLNKFGIEIREVMQ